MAGEELDQGNLLLAGINYNKNTKQCECIIDLHKNRNTGKSWNTKYIYKNAKNYRNSAKKLSQNTKNASAVTAK